MINIVSDVCGVLVKVSTLNCHRTFKHSES